MSKLELIQKSFPFKSTTARLNPDRELEVSFKTISRTNSVSFPLAYISPRPNEFRDINYVVLILFVLALVVSLWALYVLNTVGSTDGIRENALITIFFSGGLSLYFSTKLKASYSNLLVYRDVNTRETLFTISPSIPSKVEVKKFVDSLEEEIKAISYPSTLSLTDKLPIYLRHLDFLLEEGILEDAEYEKCLTRLNEAKQNNVVSLVK